MKNLTHWLTLCSMQLSWRTYSLINLTIPALNISTPVYSIQGWIVIHNIANDSLNFIRGWVDYRNGFGTPTGNYWFGLEKVRQLTANAPYRLRIELLSDVNNLWYSAEYDTFLIDSESNGYAIHVTGYYGDAGDSIAGYTGSDSDWKHNGMKFTTGDMDNKNVKSSCSSIARWIVVQQVLCLLFLDHGAMRETGMGQFGL